MNRIHIELPERLAFSVTIPVRITDINFGNHVGNPVFFELLHEARVQFLAAIGYTELNFEGFGLIMADAAIEFKSELFYGDQAEIEVGPGGTSRAGFDLLYKISARKGQSTRLAARAKTAMVTYDYGAKKVVQLPPAALVKMQAYTMSRK
jgi:acyl-CoA thioesterase FadM